MTLPDDLLAVVYRYYPRGLKGHHPDHDASEEHRRLRVARRAAGQGEGRARWDAMMTRLAARLPDCAVSDWTHLHPQDMDACYRVRIDRTPQDRTSQRELVGCVSVLGPYYMVYSSRGEPGIGKGPGRVAFDFMPEERPVVDVLIDEIEATFGYARLSPEIGRLIVPDVVSGNEVMGTNTLFDCLFTDDIW